MTARERFYPPSRVPDPSELTPVRDAQPHHGEGQHRKHKPREMEMLDTVPAPFSTVGWAELHGMDQWLDHLETITVALSQRRMSPDQRDRLYGLLERIYTDARSRRQRRRRAVA